MGNFNIFISILILCSFVSCQSENVLDKTISEKTINQVVLALRSDSTLRGSANLIEEIKYIADGRSVYSDSAYIPGYKRLVDESKFKSLRDELFGYFQEKNVTYRDIIDQKNLVKDIDERFYERMRSHSLKVKEECLRRQKETDEAQKRLNNSILFKITNLRTRYAPNSGNIVEFELSYHNKTTDVINANKVFVTIYDGFGNVVFESNITGNDPFRNGIVRYLTFYENRSEDMETYRKFERQSISGYRVEYQVKMIKLGVEIISLPYILNMNYSEDDYSINSGICLYIGDGDEEPLRRERKAIERDYENEKKEIIPDLHYLETVIDKLTVEVD